MEKELHILILEDVATDAEIIERELQKGGIKFTSKRVETEGAFFSELKNFKPDLILADYKLPQFDGFSALAIVKEQCPDVPFILISGTLGEEEAVEALKAGATDYILKQKLSRLVPAVKRALREVEVRRERKIAREKLKESESLYRTIFETTGAATIIIEEDTIVSLTNLEGERITGYSKEEIEGKKSWTEVMVKDDLDRMKEYHRLRRIDPDSAPKSYEARMIDRQGNIKNVIVTASIIPGTRKSVASILDITERKKAEKMLNESEKRFRTLFESSVTGILMADIETRKFKYANPAVCKLLGYSEQELTTMAISDIHPEYALEHVISEYEAQAKGEKILAPDIPCLRKDGTIIYADINTNVIVIEGRKYNAGFFTDITERRKAEEEIKKRVKELEEFYRMAVGREVKMIELKEEIEKLKKELEKYRK